jgi:hypothetical protein
MVTRAAIKDLLISYFDLDDAYTINDDLTVDTEGSVIVRDRGNVFKAGRLPIKFGRVDGDFDVTNTGLRTLEGAPHTVGDTFMCGGNSLTNLMHGPQSVKYLYAIYGNPLVSLDGFPTSPAPEVVSLMYSQHMPLLRLLTCNEIRLLPPLHDDSIETEHMVNNIDNILNTHAGAGKPGALKAAGELIRAGYKDNARW